MCCVLQLGQIAHKRVHYYYYYIRYGPSASCPTGLRSFGDEALRNAPTDNKILVL